VYIWCNVNKKHSHTIKHEPIIELASIEDAEEMLALQKLAYLSEAEIYNDYSIPPLIQTLPEIRADFSEYLILKATINGIIIGSVRGQLNEDGDCYIARFMVHPDFQKRGIGTRLMQAIEAEFPRVKRYTLGTGHRSESNLRLYQKLGYKPCGSERLSDKVTIVHLEKIKG
jgi:ribosomal protein S18 acetylase RimI-like enzyme